MVLVETEEQLVSRLLRQQTGTWEFADGVTVEQLLLQEPGLVERPDAVLDLITNEVFCRRRRGEEPELDDYLNRFPSVSDTLKMQWEVDRLLYADSRAGLRSASSTRSGITQSGALTRSDFPDQLGAYDVLEMLGQGGMGAVFRARHTFLGKIVALKILPNRVRGGSDAVNRFRREMRAVGTLNHPNIVQAFDAGEANGVHYIAMELVSGIDLHRLVTEGGRLSVSNACSVVFQMATALAAAHDAGMVHRDVKPSNMMIANGQVKLLDLGLARLVEVEAGPDELTSFSRIFGTPDFMAPEQWDNAHAVDHRVDLYALGCTLFYLLTGRPPYGSSEFPIASRKMKAHLLDPIPNVKDFDPTIPDEVARICTVLMAKSPDDRFHSAKELRDAIAPYATGDLSSNAIQVNLLQSPIHELSGPNRASTNRLERINTSALPNTPNESLPKRRSRVVLATASVVVTSIALYCLYQFVLSPRDVHRESLASQDELTASADKNANESARSSEQVSVKPAIANRTQDESAIATLVAKGRTFNLWERVRPENLTDGKFTDVRVEGENILLDASRESNQIWLDFKEVDGPESLVRMTLRIPYPEKSGRFKVVCLASNNSKQEYYVEFIKEQDRLMLLNAYHNRDGQQSISKEPIELGTGEYAVEVAFLENRIITRVNGKQVSSVHRKEAFPGLISLAVRGWQLELKRPIAIVHSN
jgi:serine/threonine protein kinase